MGYQNGKEEAVEQKKASKSSILEVIGMGSPGPGMLSLLHVVAPIPLSCIPSSYELSGHMKGGVTMPKHVVFVKHADLSRVTLLTIT